MAKRYIPFSELPSGEYKPGGTLGSHHCVVTAQNSAMKIVAGSVSGNVTLHPGGVLGYDCGNVWVVPSPDSYRDPIRRVLATNKLPQKILEYSNEDVRYIISWRPKVYGSACDTEDGDKLVAVKGKYTERWESFDRDEEPGKEPGGSRTIIISGGDIIVISSVFGYQPTTRDQAWRISQIVVRSSVSKAEAAKFIKDVLLGKKMEKKEKLVFFDL